MHFHVDSTEQVVDMFACPLLEEVPSKASLPASSQPGLLEDSISFRPQARMNVNSSGGLTELSISFRPQARINDNSGGATAASNSDFPPDANTSVPPDSVEVENSHSDFEPDWDNGESEIVDNIAANRRTAVLQPSHPLEYKVAVF